jgi:WD40 repeat protein
LSAALGLLALPVDAEAAFNGVNGQVVFSSHFDGADREIAISAYKVFGSRPLTSNGAEDYAPVVSPDGTRVAFVSDRDGNLELYTMFIDGSGQSRATADASADIDPSWTPDGGSVVFASDRDGDFDLYRLSLGSGATEQLTDDPAFDAQPVQAPGGSIAFTSSRAAGNLDIWSLPSGSAAPTRLTTDPSEDVKPDWSPDGGSIIFATKREGPPGFPNPWFHAYVMTASGGDPRVATGAGGLSGRPAGFPQEADPVFAPDATFYAFSGVQQYVPSTGVILLANVTGCPMFGTGNRCLNFSNDSRDAKEPDWQPLSGIKCAGDQISAIGGAEPDRLLGWNMLSDAMSSQGGRDKLIGGGEEDSLCGGAGQDVEKGGASNDVLKGGGAADTLVGGQGKDVCVGGAGKDRFKGCEVERG